MNLLKRITYLFIATLVLASCNSDDDDTIIVEPMGDYEFGFFVTNEGPFGTGTGTVTFISEDFSNVDHTIFNDVNNEDLGNIVQSMGFAEESAYIVVNNSHKIEVVNRYTFESIATISEGLNNPRFFVAAGDIGYVSNWGDPFDDNDDFIAVIDLVTNEVISTISVAFGPENLLIVRDNLYVAHEGGYGQNSIISVINTDVNTFITNIQVGDVPNSMVVYEGDLWVLCGGTPSWAGAETNGRLVKIDTDTNGVSQAFDFETTEHPSMLTIDGSLLIYGLNGEVFSKGVASTELPSTGFYSGFFYSMVAKDGKLYATDAGDFASNGTLKVYDLLSEFEIQSIEVGIIPGGVYFND